MVSCGGWSGRGEVVWVFGGEGGPEEGEGAWEWLAVVAVDAVAAAACARSVGRCLLAAAVVKRDTS